VDADWCPDPLTGDSLMHKFFKKLGVEPGDPFGLTAHKRKRNGKFERCVRDVKRSPSAKNPWAICRASLR